MYKLEYLAWKSSSSEFLTKGTLEDCLSLSAEHSEREICWKFHGWSDKYMEGHSGCEYYLITKE